MPLLSRITPPPPATLVTGLKLPSQLILTQSGEGLVQRIRGPAQGSKLLSRFRYSIFSSYCILRSLQAYSGDQGSSSMISLFLQRQATHTAVAKRIEW